MTTQGDAGSNAGNGPADEVVLGIDVGGTRIKAVVMALDGAVVHTESAPTGAQGGPDAVLENILARAGDLTRRYRPLAAGIAVPGVVDEASGLCVYAANLGWHEVPVRQWAQEELGIPVVLGHDVRTGGIAEARLGAGRGCRSFLFVPVGTGIAAAIVIDGRALHGGHGGAGELGHLVVRPGGEACACGGHGCLETYASATAIVRRYRQAGDDPRAGDAGEVRTAEEVCRRAQEGDRAAAEVWREAVDALADGLTAAVALLDPRRVVIGGGLAQAGRPLFDPLRAALTERLTFQTQPQLVPAALGHRAGSLGAGLLALDACQARRPMPARATAGQRPRLVAVDGGHEPPARSGAVRTGEGR